MKRYIIRPSEAPLCACGCGQPTKWVERREKGFPRWNIFIYNHHRNKVSFSDSHRKNLSKNKLLWLQSHPHNRYGSHQTEETRLAIGNGIKRFYRFHEHSLLGSSRPKEVGEKISKSKIERSLRGEHNSNWTGGICLHGPGFSPKLKRQIKKRDNFICRVCGDSQARLLCIHHINYDKNDHQLKNLITLCDKCHPRTNANRNWWENKLKTLV